MHRIRRWLDAIKEETGDENVFRYGVGGKDYQRELALIGISHGHGAPWLRRQLILGGADDRFFQPVATGESANLAFPGLLLRLADVMDFDASRAPRILFKHFGIDNDCSVLEWNKHLSIVGWRLDVDPDAKQQPDLRYSGECDHPVYEKAIREFKTWIDAELSAVRNELDAQRRQLPTAAQVRYDLHLPSQTLLDIRPARDSLTDQPKYIYHDLQFRLDQDEIEQLLMGESLYGDPGLCIRELLQNALDALELRELRLKTKQKGKAREPVDGDWLRPGWVREPDGREVELRVTLDWGTDEETGEQWLRVTDNGVGMTEEVIKNYFTQIGRSYYRSPEFNQERVAMKSAGEVVSPISIFGIGILSCFMIADRMRVRTSPGNVNNTDRRAYDVTISGAASLFWLEPGTLKTEGTEIVLFIKPRFHISHEPAAFVPNLRKHFYTGDELALDENHIDPALIAAMHFVWPRYAIAVELQGKRIVRIDDRFHMDTLAPFDNDSLIQCAKGWGFESPLLKYVQWGVWEWTDNASVDSTGSRVRIYFPEYGHIPTQQEVPCRTDQLATFVEPQLAVQNRTMTLVNSMFVVENRIGLEALEIAHGIGSHVWVDFRGTAAPRLTVTRNKALPPVERDAWRKVIVDFFERLQRAIAVHQSNAGSGGKPLQNLSFRSNKGDQPPRLFDLAQTLRLSWTTTSSLLDIEFAYQCLLQELRNDSPVKRDSILAEALHWYLDGAEHEDDEGIRSLEFHDSRLLIRQSVWPLPMERNRLEKLTVELALRATRLVRDLFRDIGQSFGHNIVFDEVRTWLPLLAPHLYASILQTGFHQNLLASWPAFGLATLDGRIGHAQLVGAGIAECSLDEPSLVIQFVDPHGETPAELVQRGYDLTSPMTTVPLGQLRRKCSMWRTSRWYRPLGVAPFLLPALHHIWSKHAEYLEKTLKVPHIYCLLPRFELWSKRFADWTDGDWNDRENVSALWDLSGHLTGIPGRVLWTRGTHHINEMPNMGLPGPAFFDANKA